MLYKKHTSLIFLLLLPLIVGAQAIDNTLSVKHIHEERYIRFNYENDFFSATDKYYTQGMHLELVSPAMKYFPLGKLLPHPKWANTLHGIGIEHNGYTPTAIEKEAILYGDRPFAACLFLKTFRISTDPVNRQRFSSSIITGVIGQAAGGKEMQEGIHKWTNNITPQGWHNQVNNDIILNYQAGYEKQLWSFRKALSLSMDGMARIGTFSNKAAIGGTIMIGHFESPFTNAPANRKNLRIYAYEHPEINVTVYDATLQGGMFNKSSPYTINAANITPITFQNRFGFVVIYKGLCLEYFQSMRSSDFKTGNYHVWGGIQIAVAL